MMLTRNLFRWPVVYCVVVFVAVSGLLFNGCNIVAPIAYVIEGPPTLEAQHELADVPTVVFIDDRRNVVNPITLRRVIAEKASETLMANDVVTTVIRPQDAMSVAAQREHRDQLMSIGDIGKAVGAEQVIYVEMIQFQQSPDGFTPRPISACRVKVLDIANQTRAFPSAESQEAARLVQTMTREVDPEAFRTRADRLQVFEILAVATGEQIAKLFYEHEPSELGSKLKPR